KLTMNTQNGALKINGREGQNGQVLRSNGAGQPATWTNSLNALYNNMTEYTQSAAQTLPALSGSVEINGMSNLTLVITSRSKVMFDATAEIHSNTCFGCGGSTATFVVQLFPSGGGPLTTASCRSNLGVDEQHTFATGTKIATLNPGTYTIDTVASNSNLSGPSITVSFARLNVIVIQE